MDIYNKYKSPLGYDVGNGNIDSYGVDHSNFSLRDEIEYQTARSKREQDFIKNYNSQGINKNYPQAGTNFWGSSAENNYSFGSSNITSAISAHPAMNTTLTPIEPVQTQNNNIQQLTMPAGSQYQITMPRPQEPSTWDKFKNWAENTGDAMQAASVGYATGATLGNFDEAMGAATAAVTSNPDNYTMGRDATRQLQNDLQQRHPYIYGGAEFVGAMQTPMHLAKDTTFANKALNALTDTINASAGYANNWNDFATNLAVNGAANMVGLTFDKIPYTRAVGNTTAKLLTNGRKVLKQGINSFADKLKNMYYNNDTNEEEYRY